jgi:hypothetical protein
MGDGGDGSKAGEAEQVAGGPGHRRLHPSIRKIISTASSRPSVTPASKSDRTANL